MDAPFFLNDAMAYFSSLVRCPHAKTTVGKESESVFFCNIFSRRFVKDAAHGIPYLRASEIQKADLSGGGLYLSKQQAEHLSHLRFQKGMILVTCSGTLGKCAYADTRFEDFIGTHDLIRIVPRKQNLLPGVLYAFLAGRFGYATLTHSQYGSVILHTNPTQVKEIPIPVFPEKLQDRVHRLIADSAQLREEADIARNEAIGYFAHYDVEKQATCFSKKLSDIGFSFAAYNNNLDVDAILHQYRDNSVTIGELSDRIFAPLLFKHIYLDHDNGHPFFTGREMTCQNVRPYRWLSPLGVKDIQDYKLEKGMLLLYKSGTTGNGSILGNVVIADENFDGVCLSDHVIRIRMKDLDLAYWAYAFLKSQAGIKLLQALATGTMIPFITVPRLASLRIPKPDGDLEKISRLVSAYISKRVKSNNKENEAIALIEAEIASWQEGEQ